MAMPATTVRLFVLVASASVAFADPWKVALTESFGAAESTEQWAFGGTPGNVDSGAMVSAGRELRAKLKRTFKAPAIRVEFEAKMVKADDAGLVSDLSVFVGPVFFQFGGENNCTTTIRNRYIESVLDLDEPPKIKIGQTYRIVATVDGLYCRLIIDKRVVSEALLRRPAGDVQVSLYSWTGLAHFDNLKVSTKATAGEVPTDFMLRLADKKQEQEEQESRRSIPRAIMGELRVAATIHSVGIEWDVDGDGNHNATCTVKYRKQGRAEWKDALPLLRIDYRGWYDAKRHQAFRHFNMLAGSIMFLESGTKYEIELEAADPDGGRVKKTCTVATRSEPRLIEGGRTLHVRPLRGDAKASARGDGSEKNPFLGIAAADVAAKPGDVFLLHAGEYQGTTLKKSGEPGKYIAWKAAGDGEAVLRSHLAFRASHLWFEGLTFEPKEETDFAGLRGTLHGHDGIVIVRNTFRNCRYGVSNTAQLWDGDPKALDHRWYLADNRFQGGPWTEYFTRLYMLADSDICYNHIATTLNGKGGDGIATRFCTNLDIYHNDLREIDDDLFEPDSAYANIRIWRNRGLNAKYRAVSLQPMLCSPWYIIQNEFVMLHPARYGGIFKSNVFDRTVQVNNTFVVRARYAQGRADLLLKAFSRNNLWIHIYDSPYEKTNPGGALWWSAGDRRKDERYQMHGQTRADWRTDTDYDGFDWGALPKPFWWSSGQYPDLATLSKAVGIEAHGIRVRKEEIFEVTDLHAYTGEPYSPKRLTLRKGCKAIDAGQAVPNLAETFNGKAPDLGAHEFGGKPWHYGPRR